MNQSVNVQTGELVPMLDGAPAPVALGEMAAMLDYLETFVQKILKSGEDYGTIPGTEKPSLWQPGAEKIKFAFGLADHYTTMERTVEPERVWMYQGFDWKTQNGRRVKVPVEKQARGYFRYEVRCDLIHRKSGAIWGSCIGVCESSERGRESAPANTLIKMAQKRALVGAAKSAAFLSGRFTCDVEDYQGEQSPRSNAKAAPVHEEAPEPSPKDGAYLEQAKRGEAAYLALFPADEKEDVMVELVQARLECLKTKIDGLPTSNFEMASPGTLKEYVKWLAQSYTAKKKEGSND